MNCVVISGTEMHGVTERIKGYLLEELHPEVFTEFTLPRDAPAYCTGCKQCFDVNELRCPHAPQVQPIWQAMRAADLLVFVYPVYCLRAPGQVKALLDHLGVHWFVHRPDPAMFQKRAIILTQSAGAPNGAAQAEVRTSLHWLGVSSVLRLGLPLMEAARWEALSEGRRQRLERQVRALGRRVRSLPPPRRSLRSRLFFGLARMLHRRDLGEMAPGATPSADLQYWLDQGWLR
ncbi:MAG: flavodoxin family protein [Anaerolineae bacterium]|jgi:NAD(P)H-dependent FMN reductase|nr:NAD(P)H-dependent oxidoreductase [Chloroflexota bacterium]